VVTNAARTFTEAEYLALERASDTKHEFVAGAIIAMAGIGMASSGRGRGSDAAAVGMGVMLFLVLLGGGLCVLIYLLGHHLAKYSNAARIIAAVLTILGILATVCNGLGTMAGVAGAGRGDAPAGAMMIMLLVVLLQGAYYVAQAWALLNSRSGAICTDQYKSLVAQTPSEQPPTYSSPFFWIPLVLLVLGCLIGALGGVAGAMMAR
jgi:hypothetical protein